jgi:hypothetical protein
MRLFLVIFINKFSVQHQQGEATLLVQHLFGHGCDFPRFRFA